MLVLLRQRGVVGLAGVGGAGGRCCRPLQTDEPEGSVPARMEVLMVRDQVRVQVGFSVLHCHGDSVSCLPARCWRSLRALLEMTRPGLTPRPVGSDLLSRAPGPVAPTLLIDPHCSLTSLG